ncbi:RluA family pseudouridine synthase [Lapidilactobacillus bayanensis]|uniref:RluA family pseudouridine synthase n=1 Tax=Lapidilactobacillus bayanensis TaxID=2485998 RepID=UPI000F767FD9|nr:RluA family pseudouridine synthase [Lapidilactobacillus bayanensis]
MIIKWQFFATDFPETRQMSLQGFLKKHGLSKTQIARLKFSGGQVFVGHRRRYTDYPLHDGDVVRVILAPEKVAATISISYLPIEVVYEDDLFLVVNKPPHLPSIPSHSHPTDTLSNRVKGYLEVHQAESLAIHIVTRLDMDTSGLVIFAKNAFAHALLDEQNVQHLLKKTYLALATGQIQPAAGLIDLPIRRRETHGMARMVAADGKPSQTKYQVVEQYSSGALVKLSLLTGRTHQIRVHLTALGHPLFGDALYGGPVDAIAQRQALHCAQVEFIQPLTRRPIKLTAPLPADFVAIQHELTASASRSCDQT